MVTIFCYSAADLFLSQSHAAELHMDDAVTVMRNLTLSAASNERVLTMNNFQSIVANKVQEELLSLHDPTKSASPSC